MQLVGTLPGGYWDASGTLHRRYELTLLSGREEELLTATGAGSAEAVTAVLASCLRRLGTISPVGEDVTSELLVGDRRYLMLHLRQAAFGDRVRAELVCPWPDCGRRVSLELSLSDVPVSSLDDVPPPYTVTLSVEAAPGVSEVDRLIAFRLPTGADQRELSPLLAHNEGLALSELLRRCVRRIGTQSPPSPQALEALTPLARAEIEAAMAELAPHVEDVIETDCAECGRTIMVPFDLQRLFFGDLRTDRDLLYREVHYLAFHYHWSEREIMAMSRDQRRAYIDVLAGEIDRLNHDG
ncbi:MAG: hypothetical protein ACM4D3_22130 [Candidatus Sericytochromatia bacterium]